MGCINLHLRSCSQLLLQSTRHVEEDDDDDDVLSDLLLIRLLLLSNWGDNVEEAAAPNKFSICFPLPSLSPTMNTCDS